MLNSKDFFIQHLGIGVLWKLKKTHFGIDESVVRNDAHTQSNNEFIEHHVDVIILRNTHAETSEAEQLFERILSLVPPENTFRVASYPYNETSDLDFTNQLIQSSQAKIMLIFGTHIAEKILAIDQRGLSELDVKKQYLFNDVPVMLFHAPEELLINPLLKKTTWETMCRLISLLDHFKEPK